MMLRRRAICLRSGQAALDLITFAVRLAVLAGCGFLVYFWLSKGNRLAAAQQRAVRSFPARGIVEQVVAGQNTMVISHEAIASYMDAMTMPFKVLHPQEMRAVRPGDQISFRLSVTETESWIDRIVKLGSTVAVRSPATAKPDPDTAGRPQHHPLLDYAFTNELGSPVTLQSFEGQALAVTFFFTRCPIPEFCPRLSKNFAEASRQLGQLAHGPTNWHFLSVSFDPEFDTPSVLKAYGESYRYDPAHWSFVTGPKDKILELARLSNVQVAPESGLFNHNFRTLIIDAAGRVQMIFPMGGDLSEAIVSEMLKAAISRRSTGAGGSG
jgi:protein SCO1/2